MENPASWKPAELVIDDALAEFDKMIAAGAVGPSRTHFVARRLREAGHLRDDADPEVGWPALREHIARQRS